MVSTKANFSLQLHYLLALPIAQLPFLLLFQLQFSLISHHETRIYCLSSQKDFLIPLLIYPFPKKSCNPSQKGHFVGDFHLQSYLIRPTRICQNGLGSSDFLCPESFAFDQILFESLSSETQVLSVLLLFLIVDLWREHSHFVRLLLFLLLLEVVCSCILASLLANLFRQFLSRDYWANH